MGDFITPEEVASLAQSDLDRATVELLIAGTEAAARRHCGWNITEETVTDQVVEDDWIVGGRIFLPTVYLQDVTDLTVSGSAYTVGTHYRWNRSGRLAAMVAPWSTLWESIVVSYVHGYPAGHQALEAGKDVIGSAVARRIGNPEVLASYRVGGVEETYATGPALPSIALTGIEKAEIAEAFGRVLPGP